MMIALRRFGIGTGASPKAAEVESRRALGMRNGHGATQ
jgi:hypothetical protein